MQQASQIHVQAFSVDAQLFVENYWIQTFVVNQNSATVTFNSYVVPIIVSAALVAVVALLNFVVKQRASVFKKWIKQKQELKKIKMEVLKDEQ